MRRSISCNGVSKHFDCKAVDWGGSPLKPTCFSRGSRHIVYVPYDDAPEAALVAGTTVIPVRTLADLAAHLSGERRLLPYLADAAPSDEEVEYPVDFQEVKGQEHVKRSLEVAA